MSTRLRHAIIVAALILSTALVSALGSATAVFAYVNQTNMNAALQALQTARNDLQRADANKGGHRQNAINFVNRAIREVELGIQVGHGARYPYPR